MNLAKEMQLQGRFAYLGFRPPKTEISDVFPEPEHMKKVKISSKKPAKNQTQYRCNLQGDKMRELAPPARGVDEEGRTPQIVPEGPIRANTSPGATLPATLNRI